MRTYGALNPIDQIETPADTVQTLLVAGSVGQAMDWVGATGGATEASAQLARFSGVSTVGAQLNFRVNLESTYCIAPSSGTATGSTAAHLTVMGTRVFQIPGASTGFSVAALSSGYITVEIWKK